MQKPIEATMLLPPTQLVSIPRCRNHSLHEKNAYMEAGVPNCVFCFGFVKEPKKGIFFNILAMDVWNLLPATNQLVLHFQEINL